MALEAGYLKHALVCLEALALGCTLPEAIIRLPAFKDTLKDQSAKEDIADVVSLHFPNFVFNQPDLYIRQS